MLLWKIQDWNMKDQGAEPENAELENSGPNRKLQSQTQQIERSKPRIRQQKWCLSKLFFCWPQLESCD